MEFKNGWESDIYSPVFFSYDDVTWGIVGLHSYDISFAENMISLSVFLLGIALSTNKKVSLVLACGSTALFGFFHGFTHGVEIPTNAKQIEYIIGFLTTTAGLHIVGVVSGLLILHEKKGSFIIQIIGIVISLIGVSLLINNYQR